MTLFYQNDTDLMTLLAVGDLPAYISLLYVPFLLELLKHTTRTRVYLHPFCFRAMRCESPPYEQFNYCKRFVMKKICSDHHLPLIIIAVMNNVVVDKLAKFNC